MLFSELYRIMVNKVGFVGFRDQPLHAGYINHIKYKAAFANKTS